MFQSEMAHTVKRIVPFVPIRSCCTLSIRLNPYLIFDGNAKEAIHFYEKALGGEIMGIMTYGDIPQDPDHPLPDGVQDRVMHALLKVGDSQLMFSDTYPGMDYTPGNSVEIAILPTDETRAREIFDALSEGGNVTMPLQKTDWSPLYGAIKDKYGIFFQLSVVPDESQ